MRAEGLGALRTHDILGRGPGSSVGERRDSYPCVSLPFANAALLGIVREEEVG